MNTRLKEKDAAKVLFPCFVCVITILLFGIVFPYPFHQNHRSFGIYVAQAIVTVPQSDH